MKLRSLLFVPGDRPERMEKALDLGADALILDLEDSVSPGRKVDARKIVADFLRSTRRPVSLFVRINPLDSGLAEDDLAAVVGARPDGIVLPKAEGKGSLQDLDGRLTAAGDREIRILPIASETAAAVFQLGSYGSVTDRLCGLTWGAEDLPAATDAISSRGDDGTLTDPYKMVRALTLFGAHAANVPPIETVYPAFRDVDGLTAYTAAARRDGFAGMMAIHPTQIEVINRAFTPSGVEIEHARAIVAAFEANPGAGALQLDGRMIDAPHLKRARKILAMVG